MIMEASVSYTTKYASKWDDYNFNVSFTFKLVWPSDAMNFSEPIIVLALQ